MNRKKADCLEISGLEESHDSEFHGFSFLSPTYSRLGFREGCNLEPPMHVEEKQKTTRKVWFLLPKDPKQVAPQRPSREIHPYPILRAVHSPIYHSSSISVILVKHPGQHWPDPKSNSQIRRVQYGHIDNFTYGAAAGSNNHRSSNNSNVYHTPRQMTCSAIVGVSGGQQWPDLL